jgi:hypothetical protein
LKVQNNTLQTIIKADESLFWWVSLNYSND